VRDISVVLLDNSLTISLAKNVPHDDVFLFRSFNSNLRYVHCNRLQNYTETLPIPFLKKKIRNFLPFTIRPFPGTMRHRHFSLLQCITRKLVVRKWPFKSRGPGLENFHMHGKLANAKQFKKKKIRVYQYARHFWLHTAILLYALYRLLKIILSRQNLTHDETILNAQIFLIFPLIGVNDDG